MKTKTAISGILAVALLGGCGPRDTGGEESAEHAHDHGGGADNEVHLVQQQMDAMDIELGTFRYLSLASSVKSNGYLELPPQNKASLSAVMGGRVSRIDVQEGDYVKRGQVLAALEHPDFVDMQERYLAGISRLQFAGRDYERKKSLHADSISSTKDFQHAEAEYLAARATVSGLGAKLSLLGIDPATVEDGDFLTSIPVRSPINGYVRLIGINMGQFVKPEQEMFEIVDNEHIHIDLMVYEKDLDRVKNGQKVVFSLSNDPDSVFEGTLFALGKSFEKEPRAMVVHARIDNRKGNLLPGMYVDARIITDEHRVRALPNDAIVSDGGLDYIFALRPVGAGAHGHDHDDGTAHDHGDGGHGDEYLFRKIEVNAGRSDIGFTEVVPVYYLSDSIRIVTRGAFYLLAEMKKGEGGHGHHH